MSVFRRIRAAAPAGTRRPAALRILSAALCLSALLSGCAFLEEEELEREESGLIPAEEQAAEAPPEPAPAPVPTNLPTRFSLPYESEHSLDPYLCPDGPQQIAVSLMYEGLFRLDEQMEPENCLCEKYTCNDDFTSYTFNLRWEVAFTDGTYLKGSDVRNALERARESQRYRARLSRVTQITSTERSVTIKLNAPNSGFPALLDVPICKPGKGRAPLGTGPYYYGADDEGACLLANLGWWRGQRQPLQRIALVNVGDSLLYRFKTHDVQLMVADFSSGEFVSVAGDVGYADAATTDFHYLVCNAAAAWPMNISTFRRALLAGINRDSLVSAFLSGHGAPAQFPVSPVSRLYPTELEIDYSVETVRGLLQQMWYEGSRTLKLLVNSDNSFKVGLAKAIAENYRAMGIPVQVKALPWEEFRAAAKAREFDLCYCETRMTADWSMSALVASWGNLNYSGWSDARMAGLLEQYAASSDRTEGMKALCAHLKEQSPILPICFSSSTVLMQSNALENLSPTAAEPFYNLPECVFRLKQS
ncbi:MAG: ABC transporter substrate-binding protein [Oscillibacter sp.]|nr:ABC transporter substrate-binding protein [Oscillibacter sp.]